MMHRRQLSYRFTLRWVLLLPVMIVAAFGTVGFTALAVAAIGPDPDIEITFIERTPRYESWKGTVIYVREEYTDDFTPYEVESATGITNPGAKHWPDPGEPVKFTAHVRNRGPSTVSEFSWEWRIDGVTVASGTFNGSLAAGDEVTFNHFWSWQGDRHTVTFATSLAGDATPRNNELTDFTDALTLFTLIETTYDRTFTANTALVSNPSTAYITEWLQNHIQRYNQLFEESGAATRVRYDRLDIVPDGSNPNGCQPSCYRYDGAFPEVFQASDSDLRLGGSAYYDEGEDIDYGLLHELGHQLGLIDLYRINMESAVNKVNGLPYLAQPGLMRDVSQFIAPHTAGALDSWHGYRRGYFGQYLYDVPTSNFLRLADLCGESLAGAQITVYQKIERVSGEEEMPDIAKFSGSADGAGIYELPNVNVNTANFPPTETGNLLQPNPFGYISNHGENGLFMFEVEALGQVGYEFLDITAFNEAYWDGHTDTMTYDLEVPLIDDPIPTNLALGGEASADISSYSSGWCLNDIGADPNVPANANDGDAETAWCRDSIESGDYWQADLGSEAHLYRLALLTNYRSYRVEGSLTGAFAGEQELMLSEDDGLTCADSDCPLQIYSFRPITARYVRLTVEQAQEWTVLREVEIYAAEEPCGQVSPEDLIAELLGNVIELNLPQGISESLSAMLEAALNALQAENENNELAATNILNAFVNAVRAQKGKMIPEAAADALSEAAQAIMDAIVR